METVIILGAGQFGRGAARLLNQENMALLAYRLPETTARKTGAIPAPAADLSDTRQ